MQFEAAASWPALGGFPPLLTVPGAGHQLGCLTCENETAPSLAKTALPVLRWLWSLPAVVGQWCCSFLRGSSSVPPFAHLEPQPQRYQQLGSLPTLASWLIWNVSVWPQTRLRKHSSRHDLYTDEKLKLLYGGCIRTLGWHSSILYSGYQIVKITIVSKTCEKHSDFQPLGQPKRQVGSTTRPLVWVSCILRCPHEWHYLLYYCNAAFIRVKHRPSWKARVQSLAQWLNTLVVLQCRCIPK